MPRTVILRMGHRFFRDSRVTTHVCLTARALGADGVLVADKQDREIESTIRGMVQNFGGNFRIETGIPWKQAINNWKRQGGRVAHLTAYGLPLPKVVENIRGAGADILVIVGAEKMPGEVFKLADWNVSITSQPMSEVGALAIFLDWLNQHKGFDLDFPDAKIQIIPSKEEKKIRQARN